MYVQESTVTVGDAPQDEKKYYMATCPKCGGRGGSYDSEGDWHVCQECGGSGQVNY
jgi:ssDNA-binding Zn-finger/Zn-ribbon topoisomerase 1